MTRDQVTLLALGAALTVIVFLLELFMRKRRRQPGWGTERFVDLDGKEWYLYRGAGAGGVGDSGGGDGGAGNVCHGGHGDGGGH